ncbi:MAG: transcription antitermination factor NusB [Deltaproteobacteria bacterium]|jgi:transcription antitermination factor NusB|nr:transcription antitermination factor NusB [Deltaproteobacteria bacterium]
MGSRRKARECILQMLYQYDLVGSSANDVIRNYWSSNNADDDIRIFSNEMLSGIVKDIESIDKRIADNSTNWKITRMAAVDKNILRLAVYELFFRDDIPVKVTINEAVEVAKKYGTKDSGSFVNGVLDNIAKGIKKEVSGGEEVLESA